MKWLMDTPTKKLQLYRLILNIITIVFLAVIPIIVVSSNYHIFTTEKATKVSGWVVIFTILILVPLVKYLGKLIDNMPDIKICGEHKGEINTSKYFLKTIKRLILPLAILIMMVLFKEDVNLAFNTFTWVVSSMIVSMVVDEMLISPINYVIKLDTANAEQDARDLRREKNKN